MTIPSYSPVKSRPYLIGIVALVFLLFGYAGSYLAFRFWEKPARFLRRDWVLVGTSASKCALVRLTDAKFDDYNTAYMLPVYISPCEEMIRTSRYSNDKWAIEMTGNGKYFFYIYYPLLYLDMLLK
jgi:hypothetical protein